MDGLANTTIVGIAGFGIGILFGAVTRWTDFCALGALADMGMNGDFRRLRSWLLAIAVGILGSHLLHWHGSVDLYRSIYLSPSLGWLGAILGGLIFGYGTVMARGCGGRSLIRLAGGDLRALITLLALGMFSYMTLRGITGTGRLWLEGTTNVDLAGMGLASQGIPEIISHLLDLAPDGVRTVCALAIGSAVLWFCLKDAPFRTSRKHVIAGVGIGVLATAGWAVTGILGFDEFEPAALASLTFVRPIGDSLQYLMTFTGATITFGIAAVGGTLIGGFAVAVAGGTMRIEGFNSASEMTDYLIGGALMGIGGVLALGCTIGQGVTGIATLSFGSALSVAAILAGGAVAIAQFGLNTADEALGPAPGE